MEKLNSATGGLEIKPNNRSMHYKCEVALITSKTNNYSNGKLKLSSKVYYVNTSKGISGTWFFNAGIGLLLFFITKKKVHNCTF